MFQPSFQQHVSVLLIVLGAFLTGLNLCQAIRLNPNGGYDIVIGIEDNTPEPLNVEVFLDEIKVGVESFSLELWKTTKRRFFINSVDVLVPPNWWTVSRYERATWQTLLGSEIRVTHDIATPNVVNPNPCGTPGLYLEIPDSFFKISTRAGHFGAVGKSLVNLWARYRFGVWEEHGIPGDTKFPYFYTHPSLESKWEATGCNNEPITGSILTVDGDISDRCDPLAAKGPDDDCRFYPSDSNTANSSLLHFHWMESITEFCDSKSHNHAAPNRHNLFCGHRSIWEVIRQSADYLSTKSCTDTVTPPKFRILKENSSPEFYILLDRGRTVTPEKVLQEVMGAMVKFIGTPSLERVNIAVGTYPHANQGKNHYYVKEEVGWAPISSVIYDVQSVLEDASNTEGPVIRDFGLAIQEVAEKIKQRNHLAGTVILVIKRGATANFFDKLTFEQEVISSIKDDSRIKVFAIETQQGVQNPYTNLQSLVQDTVGKYHLINDTMNTARKLERFLADMQEILEQSSIMNSLTSWVTQKQYTEPHETIEIPIHDNVNLVRVHLTTSRQMLESDIYLEQISGEHTSVALINRAEWNENSDLSRRVVFSYLIRNPKQGSIWSLKHGCPDEKTSDCRSFLLVSAENDRGSPRQSTFNSHSIDISVSSSAEYNYLDMSHHGLKVVPFAIFAKVEMNQQRVLGLENVTALIRLGGDHSISWSVPLHDDGLVQPDVASHDGIYSGVFTPMEDGLYQISVSASGVSGDGSFQDIRIVNHPGSLMPKDQINFGCKNSTKPRCISAVPRGSFSKVQDMMGTIAVENSATFKPGLPMKIMDFSATTLPNYGIEFGFTSPRLLGSDAMPEEFRIYMAPHVDNFLESTDVTKLLIQQIGEPPGTYVKIYFNAVQKAIPYYAVEAIYGGQKSAPSNVIGVVPTELGTPPFPTTTSTQPPTTTEPPTTRDEATTTTEEPAISEVEVLTTTTEFPWPSTSTTTGAPFSSTTEESEDPEVTETPSTSSSTTEDSESDIPSAIPSSSSTTTEEPLLSSSTTEGSEITSTTSSELASSSSTTTEVPSTSTTELSDIPSANFDLISSSSTTTEIPLTSLSTTEDSEITITTSDELPSSSSTTTEIPSTDESQITIMISSELTSSSPTTTEIPSTSSSTTEDSESDIHSVILSSSSTTTETPSTSSSTTESSEITIKTSSELPSSSSTTTEIPSTSSSTTEDSESDIPSAMPSSSSTTTEEPLTSSSTTELSDIPRTAFDLIFLSSTTTETPSTSSSTTDESQITITISSELTSSSSTTTEEASTSSSTTEDSESDIHSLSLSSSSSTTEMPSTSSSTTEDSESDIPSAMPSSSSTTTEIPSISSSTTEDSESDIHSVIPSSSSSTTEMPSTSSSTTEESEITITTSSELPSSSSTTTQEPSTSSSTTESSESDIPSAITVEPLTSSSTTEDSEITSTKSSELPSSSSTTTEDPSTSSSTTEDSESDISSAIPSSSSTTTETPSTSSSTTEDSEITITTSSELPSSSSTTTEIPSTSDIPSTTSDLPSSSSTTTEEPSLSSSTTEDSESDIPSAMPSSSSTTTEIPSISSSTTEDSESVIPSSSSSTTETPSTSASFSTTEGSEITSTTLSDLTSLSSTTTEEPSTSSSTTEGFSISSTTSDLPSSSSTTTEIPLTSSSTTEESEITITTSSELPSASSTTTQEPSTSSSTTEGSESDIPSAITEEPLTSSSTTEDSEITSTTSSELPSFYSSTTEELSISSSTTEDSEITSTTSSELPSSSSSTTEDPSTSSSTTEDSNIQSTTSDLPSSSSTTTEIPSTSSSTTENSESDISSAIPSSSSTTTEEPSLSTSTTEGSEIIIMTSSEVLSSSSSTTEEPTTSSSSSPIEESQITNRTSSDLSFPSFSTTEFPSTSSSSLREESEMTITTSSEPPSSSTTVDSSSTTSDTLSTTSDTSTSSESSTPEPPSSLSTSEQASSSSSNPGGTDPTVSSSFRVTFSHTLLVILSCLSIYCHRIIS